MAGALDCRLSGPRVYADRVADEPWLNAAAPDPDAADLRRGIALAGYDEAKLYPPGPEGLTDYPVAT